VSPSRRSGLGRRVGTENRTQRRRRRHRKYMRHAKRRRPCSSSRLLCHFHRVPLPSPLPDCAPASLLCPDCGRSHKLERENGEGQYQRPVDIFRRATNDAKQAQKIRLDDPEVSGLHCAIEVRRDTILLHDLNSRNGTYVDDDRVVAVRLEPPTSQFRIGSSLLQISVLSKTTGNVLRHPDKS
jgi:hypothetical protein